MCVNDGLSFRVMQEEMVRDSVMKGNGRNQGGRETRMYSYQVQKFCSITPLDKQY